MPGEPNVRWQLEIDVTDSFVHLLERARNALGRDLKTNRHCIEDPERSEVDLATFGYWAASIGIPLPQHMPRLGIEGAVHVAGWPWGQYDTQLLRILAKAVDKFWKNYDPADPTTAPTNDTVTAWLKQEGVATRTAEVMASIMRADDLRTGPR